jgi:transposase
MKYNKEFKIQTVQMMVDGGKTVAQVSRELDISDKTLYYWMKQYKQDPKHAFPGTGNLTPEDRELRDMKRKIRDLEEENAILKKAMSIFAKDRD